MNYRKMQHLEHLAKELQKMKWDIQRQSEESVKIIDQTCQLIGEILYEGDPIYEAVKIKEELE